MRRLYRKICIIAMCMVIITGANGCTIPYSADQPAESETVAEATETTTEITEAVTETTEERL